MHQVMYDELASWWPLLSAPADYAEEAALYRRALLDAAEGEVRAVLELGSGGGNNASWLKRDFRLTLVDRSPGMLAVSRELNPECEHVEADMRDVRLGRRFDAVFVHDAICYMTTEADVRRVLETAYIHTRPGGAALFAPDHVEESFRESTRHGGHDSEGRGLRYLSWTRDPDPADTTYTVDYAFLLSDADGTTRVEHDRHLEGLFPREHWIRWIEAAGFEPDRVAVVHSEVEDELELFVGRRPPD